MTNQPTSIKITLQLQADDQVSCHLETNQLPFPEVKRQMLLFVKALQWQIDDEKLCPFHLDK